jgi:hypothetical protein
MQYATRLELMQRTVNLHAFKFQNPARSTYDTSIGAAKGPLSAQLYAENLTNVITSTLTSTAQFVLAGSITRSRVIGIQLNHKL